MSETHQNIAREDLEPEDLEPEDLEPEDLASEDVLTEKVEPEDAQPGDVDPEDWTDRPTGRGGNFPTDPLDSEAAAEREGELRSDAG